MKLGASRPAPSCRDGRRKCPAAARWRGPLPLTRHKDMSAAAPAAHCGFEHLNPKSLLACSGAIFVASATASVTPFIIARFLFERQDAGRNMDFYDRSTKSCDWIRVRKCRQACSGPRCDGPGFFCNALRFRAAASAGQSLSVFSPSVFEALIVLILQHPMRYCVIRKLRTHHSSLSDSSGGASNGARVAASPLSSRHASGGTPIPIRDLGDERISQ
jgi:hypothetical protein